jgi:hypothetical protein
VASAQTATIVGGYANGVGGSTLNALQNPTGLSTGVDNSLYVADYGNNRVIKLQEGFLVGSIVAGTGVAGNSFNQLNGPTGVHVDSSLNIYVADSNNYRIMFWWKNASTGVKVAGTGSSGSTLSSFSIVAGLYVDSQGNIYVCDAGNSRIMVQQEVEATNSVHPTASISTKLIYISMLLIITIIGFNVIK